MANRQTLVKIGALVLVLSGCAAVRSTVRDASDVAREMCEVVLAQRPEVKAQAQRQKLNPADVAKALCAVNDVVNPFLQGAQQAGSRAVGAAHKLGKLTAE